MTLFKVIEGGRVAPVNSLERVAARLADAHGRGTDCRVKVVPRFPGSQQERDLTPDEFRRVVALAAYIVDARTGRASR